MTTIDLKNEQGDLDVTLVVDIISCRGEFDPSEVKQVVGSSFETAKARLKIAIDEHEEADYSEEEIDENVRMFKLDEYTYFILTGEDEACIVGSPKSEAYGEFWSLINDDPEAAAEMFEDMDIASEDAEEIEL